MTALLNETWLVRRFGQLDDDALLRTCRDAIKPCCGHRPALEELRRRDLLYDEAASRGKRGRLIWELAVEQVAHAQELAGDDLTE